MKIVKSRVLEDNRRALLQYILTLWTESSDVSIQRRHWQPLSVHLWAYCTQPTQDVNDVMCEGWPQHQGIRPTCSVFYYYYFLSFFIRMRLHGNQTRSLGEWEYHLVKTRKY